MQNYIIEYTALIGGVFFGIVLARVFYKKNTWINHLLLIFSGAYLLCINLLHNLPSIFKNSESEKEVGLFIIIGIIIQMILESFSKGVEHGHVHHPKKLSSSIIFGLMTHAFLEGMPIGKIPHCNMLIAVVVHKIPITAILYLSLASVFKNVKKVYLFMLFFALMTPLGSLVNRLTLFNQYPYYILALVSGIFIHISTTILFENSSKFHQLSWVKLGMIVFAALLILMV